MKTKLFSLQQDPLKILDELQPHKNLVIDLHASGLFTTEIASKTYHSEEAVDRYLDLFYSMLILHIYNIPVYLMARVTGRGQTLIEVHLELIQQYFPDKTAIIKHLNEHGVDILKTFNVMISRIVSGYSFPRYTPSLHKKSCTYYITGGTKSIPPF